MIAHELLWMLFLGSIYRNIRNKMRVLLRNVTNKQNKLNSANSLNGILTFMLCQYIHFTIIIHLWNYLQRMLWLTTNYYGCYFFRAVIVTSVKRMLALRQTNKINWIMQIVSIAFSPSCYATISYLKLSPFIQLYVTDAMIGHELLWMLFLERSNPNIREKNACIITKSDEQNKLNSTNSLNSILNFLLFHYHWTAFRSVLNAVQWYWNSKKLRMLLRLLL